MSSAQYCCLAFNKMWSFSTDFRFVPSNKFHENPSRGNRTDTCGQTDRPEEANSLFSLFVRRRPNGKFWVEK